jgi:hypothetical protein
MCGCGVFIRNANVLELKKLVKVDSRTSEFGYQG